MYLLLLLVVLLFYDIILLLVLCSFACVTIVLRLSLFSYDFPMTFYSFVRLFYVSHAKAKNKPPKNIYIMIENLNLIFKTTITLLNSSPFLIEFIHY